jgi:hypothetical protein
MATAIIPHAWIKVEGLRIAKNAVKLAIRDRGLKLTEYAAKDITRMAEEYWFEHRAELIGQATIGLLFARGSVRIPPKFRTLRNSQASKAKEFSR